MDPETGHESDVAENGRPGIETQHRAAPAGRRRRWAVAALVVLASIGFALSAVTIWAHRAVLSTDGWVNTVGPVLQDPEVVASMSEVGAGQLVIALDVQNRAQEALPENLQLLAMPITAASRQIAADVMVRVLSDPGLQDLWLDANRMLHETALAVLRGESDVATIYPDGAVRLNLFPLMDRALTRIEDEAPGLLDRGFALPELTATDDPSVARQELSSALGVELPPDFGEVEVANSEQLVALQKWVRLFDAMTILLPLLSIALLADAVYLSRRRWRTALQLGLGTAVAMFSVYLLAAWVADRLAAATPARAGGVFVQAVLDIALGNLTTWLIVLLICALAVAAVAYMAGRRSTAV